MSIVHLLHPRQTFTRVVFDTAQNNNRRHHRRRDEIREKYQLFFLIYF